MYQVAPDADILGPTVFGPGLAKVDAPNGDSDDHCLSPGKRNHGYLQGIATSASAMRRTFRRDPARREAHQLWNCLGAQCKHGSCGNRFLVDDGLAMGLALGDHRVLDRDQPSLCWGALSNPSRVRLDMRNSNSLGSHCCCRGYQEEKNAYRRTVCGVVRSMFPSVSIGSPPIVNCTFSISANCPTV